MSTPDMLASTVPQIRDRFNDQFGNLRWRDIFGSPQERHRVVLNALRSVLDDSHVEYALKIYREYRDDVIKMAERRRFKMPKAFAPFEDVTDRFLHDADMGFLGNVGIFSQPDMTALQFCSVFRAWHNEQGPVLAVKRELLEALSRTDPPKEFTFGNVMWPYTDWAMAFPRGFMKSPDGHDVTYVMVKVKIGSEDELNDELSEREQKLIEEGSFEDGRGKNLFTVIVITDGPAYYRTICPELDDDVEKFMNFPDIDNSNLNDNDDEMIQRIIALVFNMALFFMAVPDDVEDGGFVKAIKPPKSKRKLKKGPKDELWAPNVVGRSYARSLNADGEGTHRSPRTHWRRGHWKHVVHGKGRKERRLSWISATLVNAKKEE